MLGAEWLYGTWPEDWRAYDITFLELYPIVLSSILWGGRFSNRIIEFHTDNLALVSIINKCSSRKPHIMLLVRALVKSMLCFNFFVFYAIHIPGVQNVLADALSHDQIGLFSGTSVVCPGTPRARGLMAQVKDILQKSLSPTTWSQYAKIWSDFVSFSRTVLETPAALG